MDKPTNLLCLVCLAAGVDSVLQSAAAAGVELQCPRQDLGNNLGTSLQGICLRKIILQII